MLNILVKVNLMINLCMVKSKQSDKNTEAIILEAAARVFTRTGFAGARMEEIASEAGINRALLHYYFRSKEKLFETVFRTRFAEFVQGIAAINLAELSLVEKIEKLVDHQINSNRANPGLAHFIMHELNCNPESLIQLAQENSRGFSTMFQAFSDSVNEEIIKGNIRPIKPTSLWINIMSMSIFPFIGKPMLSQILKIDQTTFEEFLEYRKKEIPEFIIQSIRKK